MTTTTPQALLSPVKIETLDRAEFERRASQDDFPEGVLICLRTKFFGPLKAKDYGILKKQEDKWVIELDHDSFRTLYNPDKTPTVFDDFVSIQGL